MVTLRAEGCTTAEYVSSSGTADTTDSPTDEVDCDEPDDEPVKADTDAAGDDCDPSTDGNDNESQSNILPLLFLYDCESTGGSTYDDHILT